MSKLKVWSILALCFVLLLTVVAPASAKAPAKGDPAFPSKLPLPNGFAPEGIAIGYGTDFYVGSLVNGAIYRGDLRTGEGDVFIEGQTGRVAVGLEFDKSTGYLYVAGGPTGTATVYDTRTGEAVQTYTLTTENTFINDVVVTRQAAYFTDSASARLFVLPLQNGEPPAPGAVRELPLTGEWQQLQGFNANGIEASPSGKALIVVNSTAGALYRVDSRTGEAQKIDLGGESVAAGDGLLLLGKTLYVVRNRLNLIAVLRMNPGFLSGELVKTITDPNFAVPTTVDNLGRRLYVVNARFGTTPGPDVEYWVTKVTR